MGNDGEVGRFILRRRWNDCSEEKSSCSTKRRVFLLLRGLELKRLQMFTHTMGSVHGLCGGTDIRSSPCHCSSVSTRCVVVCFCCAFSIVRAAALCRDPSWKGRFPPQLLCVASILSRKRGLENSHGSRTPLPPPVAIVAVGTTVLAKDVSRRFGMTDNYRGCCRVACLTFCRRGDTV